MSWREITLGEAIRVKHGYAFKGEFFARNGSHLVVTPGNFHEAGGLRVRDGKERFYVGDIPEDFVLAKDDLIVAMTEQGEGLLGSSAWIPEDDFFLHNQRIGLISQCDETLLHKRYLYWLFNTPNIRSQIRASATGAKVKHTAPERLYKVRVSIPGIAEQQKITALLDDLDENQAVLQRQVSLLEKATRLIYTEWFVRLRFPGHESTPQLNSVPAGWTKSVTSEFVDVLSGGTPDTKTGQYWDGEIPFFTPADAPDCVYVTNTEKHISEDGLNACNSHLFPKDIVFITARGTVGKIVLAQQPMAMNQSCYALRTKDRSSQFFLLCAMQAITEHFKQAASGGVFDTIVVDTFRHMPITWPSREVIDQFDKAVAPIFGQIETLLLQIAQLRQTRDLLLPRLISGQLRL
jgi:type I restriction enzyme, S subunit